MSQSNHASQGYYLAQPAWYLVRQFAGIYGVKMNYKAVKKLNRDVISRAYFDVAKLPAITRTVTYNNRGQPEKLSPIKSKDWIAMILKRAAIGYNNRQFYESLASTMHPPPVKCPCGAMVCSTEKGTRKHRSTKAHINAMLALDNWTGGHHCVILPRKVQEGELKYRNPVGVPGSVGSWTTGIPYDISPYIGGKIKDLQVDHTVSPPVVTWVKTHHTYDSIMNDLKADGGVRRNGQDVYGPFDTRKQSVTTIQHPSQEQFNKMREIAAGLLNA
tara:strand:+ start:139 stop:957 length:819 start_codon:yes stop_codon:yes gene_type:complete